MRRISRQSMAFGMGLVGLVLGVALSAWGDGGHAGRVTVPVEETVPGNVDVAEGVVRSRVPRDRDGVTVSGNVDVAEGVVRSRVPRDRDGVTVPDGVVPTVWAHRPYVVRMAVTNRAAGARTVAKVTTSCACLTAKAAEGGGGHAGRVTVPVGIGVRGAPALPEGVIPFELTLNPAGMEGLVTKTASVTFDDGTVETMKIRVNVRTRVKLAPGDAAFGVVRSFDREIEVRLVGIAVTNGGAKIVSVLPPENPQFDVRVSDDGLGVVVGSRVPRDRRPAGALVETWHVTTTDAEIPKIPFVVSAQVVDGFTVTPSVLTVDGGDGGRGGRVTVPGNVDGAEGVVRSRVPRDREGVIVPGCVASRIVSLRRDDRRAFKVLSAETKPRKWGEVKVEKRPLNGWMIRIDSIDPDELRQFSKNPYLLVRTDCPDMESLEIPMRVAQKGTRE